MGECMLINGPIGCKRVATMRKCIAVGSFVAFSLACGSHAQSPVPQSSTEFEVATIKPGGATPGGSTYQFLPGGIRITNGTLKGIIETAYDVRDFQIDGGPG